MRCLGIPVESECPAKTVRHKDVVRLCVDKGMDKGGYVVFDDRDKGDYLNSEVDDNQRPLAVWVGWAFLAMGEKGLEADCPVYSYLFEHSETNRLER